MRKAFLTLRPLPKQRAAICRTPGCTKHAQHLGFCRAHGREHGFLERQLAKEAIARREAKIESLKRVEELRTVPREIMLDGKVAVVVWAGRGPLPGMGDTPKNLGSSLMNTSRIIA